MASPEFSIEYSGVAPDPEWDRFLAEVSGAHFEQTSLWAIVRQNYGWRSVRWLVRERGKVVGGIQLQTRRLWNLGEIGYIVRGPMCRERQQDIMEHLVDVVTDYCSERRYIYVVFDLPYPDRGLSDVLDRKRYGLHPKGIPPTGLITATLLLDLSQDWKALTSAMLPSVRRNIRIGQKSELKFDCGGPEHIDTFRELMIAICSRRGSAPTPPYPDFFRRLWEVMGNSDLVRLFLVRSGEEIVSAALAFTLGDTVRVWKVGWAGRHKRKYPNHLLWWSIIGWAKEHSFREMDFVWVDEQDAVLLAKGEKRPEAFRDGSTFFKMGFGGRLVAVPRARSRFFHPALRLFNSAAARRWLESQVGRRVLGRLWRSLQTSE